MIDEFHYSQFRADFIACKRNTHFYDPWWTDPDIWQDRDYTIPVHRPVEELAFSNIAHECHTYTRREVKANRDRAFSEVLREVLVDMRQERIISERIARRNLPLRERLAARGLTLMWQHLDTRKRNIVEVLANP